MRTHKRPFPPELRYESGQLSIPDPDGPFGLGWVARVNREGDSPLGGGADRDAFAAELCRRWNAGASPDPKLVGAYSNVVAALDALDRGSMTKSEAVDCLQDARDALLRARDQLAALGAGMPR